MKSKIHRVTVTQTELGYAGSITVDGELLEAAGMVDYEKVLVVDIDNGSRLETYCIPGPRGSGLICLNGAAARLVAKGDKVIIMAFCHLTTQEAKFHRPIVVLADQDNKIADVKRLEVHGPI